MLLHATAGRQQEFACPVCVYVGIMIGMSRLLVVYLRSASNVWTQLLTLWTLGQSDSKAAQGNAVTQTHTHWPITQKAKLSTCLSQMSTSIKFLFQLTTRPQVLLLIWGTFGTSKDLFTLALCEKDRPITNLKNIIPSIPVTTAVV